MKIKKPRDFKFNLGDKVKDDITGLEGIVIYRSQWLNNCNTYGIQPTDLHEGKPVDKQHFDEPQLTIVKEKVFKAKRDTGGPSRALTSTSKF